MGDTDIVRGEVKAQPLVTVLGIGNPIMGDDGVGLELLALLETAYSSESECEVAADSMQSRDSSAQSGDGNASDIGCVEKVESQSDEQLGTSPYFGHNELCGNVAFVDGGTGGMELVPVVGETEKLLILDAIAPCKDAKMQRDPGTALRISGDQVPRLLSSKMSPHQVGILDVLTASRLLGREPEQVEVVGIVADSIDLRVGLSQKVSDSLDDAIKLAQSVLAEWGIS